MTKAMMEDRKREEENARKGFLNLAQNAFDARSNAIGESCCTLIED